MTTCVAFCGFMATVAPPALKILCANRAFFALGLKISFGSTAVPPAAGVEVLLLLQLNPTKYTFVLNK